MSAKRRKTRKKTSSSREDFLARERALEALHLMRSKDISLTRAAREAHTTPETTRKHVGRALIRSKSGRYKATTSDRLTRRVWFFTETQKIEVAVRGPRQASRVAEYMSAVDWYLRTGDPGRLDGFRGQTIRSRNQAHVFLTDTEALERLADAGEVPFDRLYVLRA